MSLRDFVGMTRPGSKEMARFGKVWFSDQPTVPVGPRIRAPRRAIETHVGTCTLSYRRVAVAEVVNRPWCIATT